MNKVFNIEFTEAELDVIFDAISDLELNTDNEEVLDLISIISAKLYDKCNGFV